MGADPGISGWPSLHRTACAPPSHPDSQTPYLRKLARPVKAALPGSWKLV